MKKAYFLVLFAVISLVAAKAQNIQLHYDFGESRKLATATIEMFKPDKYGSTFFFVDMDFGGTNGTPVADFVGERTNNMNLAYFEIARGFKFWEAPIEMTVEYNGGFLRDASAGGYPLSTAYLAGPSYTMNSKDWSKVLTFKALYKQSVNVNNIEGFGYNNVQFTAVWVLNFFDNKFTATGFADWWTEKVPVNGAYIPGLNEETASSVFLTEPQFWYNFNKNFSFGSEIEISNNFALNKGWMVNPTVAAKYTF
ncbi:DUF5020 family protein [Saccharicrinis aurantiacus]|uniref:DUF5020 family protein n=1 Tax=Saccharicrinis aurantiacus TaxID=1849719 RepID=UPI00249060DA|nr:DUF5020 family protein [Saccharicrinis aurantiacus]